jgi:hypothetical protein
VAKNKKKQAANRFEIGRHRGCEALLYQFKERRLICGKDAESEHQGPEHPLGSHAVHIAAVTFEEAFAYLRSEQPDFNVDSVTCLGLIEMVSGSPLD